MTTHNFSFDGGNILKNMGATWFDSYCYYDHCDKSHTSWSKVSTAKMRTSYYNRSKHYHKEWLKHIVAMNEANLSKNTIGVTPRDTMKMARAILAKPS